MKFGRIKKQHSRVSGLDLVLQRLAKECPLISRIVPGRIQTRKGTAVGFKIQYATAAGLKCLYAAPGVVQEVFLVCSDAEAVARWMRQAPGLLQND